MTGGTIGFYRYPVARSFNKIFGIGLSKTGTTSLTEALKLLSLRVEHFVFDYDLEVLDGAADIPVARDYKRLDEQFHGSKFILTGRDMEEWLVSCSYHFLAPATDPRIHQLRMDIYGCEKFDKERFRTAYLRHREDVLRHFAHRPWDLLEMDICAGDGWEKLCLFLGHKPPKAPFPAANQTRLFQGMALQRQGRLAEAERCYGEVLQRQPNHVDALHLLGVIARQTRRAERAVELIKKAIVLNPKVAVAHSNLGNVLMDLKRSAEALASYNKAIALKPDFAEAYHNRGNALADLKRSAEALASYDKAIALKPNFAEAYNNRGNALMDLRRPADALASYDKAIALKPDFAEAYNNRGNALTDLRRVAEALACYDKAIALKPDYANAYNNRGATLHALRRHEDLKSRSV